MREEREIGKSLQGVDVRKGGRARRETKRTRKSRRRRGLI
jgi:hypothetical protein